MLNVMQGAGNIVEYPIIGTGHSRGIHDGTGKTLAGFKPGRGAGGAERGDPRGVQAIGQSQRQGDFRPYRDQIDGSFGGGRNYAVNVAVRYVQIFAQLCSTGIAGSGVDLLNRRRTSQPPGQCVLTPSGSHDQDTHR